MADVTIITVCYHSREMLADLIKSLPDNLPLMLVNNSQDDEAEISSLASGHIKVIQSEKNIGFGAACNLGASDAQTQYLLFLNPDTRLMPGAIDALLSAGAQYSNASAFNPKLTDDRGRVQNKRRSVLLESTVRPPERVFEEGGEVPVLTGAALFVRRDAFVAVGGFDENIFLYHEDDDLSLRLARLGPLRTVPGATIVHREGHGSGDRKGSAGIKAYHMGRSRVYALSKHGRPFARSRSISLALAQLIAPPTWFSKRKRIKQWHFLRGILSIKDEH